MSRFRRTPTDAATAPPTIRYTIAIRRSRRASEEITGASATTDRDAQHPDTDERHDPSEQDHRGLDGCRLARCGRAPSSPARSRRAAIVFTSSVMRWSSSPTRPFDSLPLRDLGSHRKSPALRCAVDMPPDASGNSRRQRGRDVVPSGDIRPARPPCDDARRRVRVRRGAGLAEVPRRADLALGARQGRAQLRGDDEPVARRRARSSPRSRRSAA